MSSSPGIMDGDEHHTKIILGNDAKVTIRSQAYQRLFPMRSGATHNIKICLDHYAGLQFLQKPIVPQANSIYHQHQKIYSKSTSRFIIGEIITCGRKLNGELFSFTKFHSVTEIYINERLVIKENVLIEPSKIRCSSFGELEEFSHQATLFCYLPQANKEIMKDELLQLSTLRKDLCIGFTWPEEHVLVVRTLCHHAQEADELQNTIASILIMEKEEAKKF
jgi:urease accessory protein